MSTEETLAAVPIFRDLPKKSLSRIAQFARKRSFRAGDVIFKEGEEGVGFFMVTAGQVGVTRGGADLAKTGEGGFFGEMALLDNHRRSATITALEDTECLAIMRSDFIAELRANADLAIELLGVLSQRIRALDEQLAVH